MKYIHKKAEIQAVLWDGLELTRKQIQDPKFNVMDFRVHPTLADGKLLIANDTRKFTADIGDYVVTDPDLGLKLMPPQTFELNYKPIEENNQATLIVHDYQEPNYSSIEQLTILQEELGYKKGEISTVAMLGLVGEAGEVLYETGFHDQTSYGVHITSRLIDDCRAVEDLKKQVRSGTSNFKLFLPKDKEELFDAELADTFGYVNALAINRGLTIFDLAQMLHDKIRAKQAAGGSSEDPKNK